MKNQLNNTLKLQKKFKLFLKREFKSQPVDTIKNDLKDILGPLPEINWPINSTFFTVRARTVDETKEDISDPKTFGAPPPDKTKQGRANLENHPVFYGGFDDRTAMHEIKVPKDTECFVSIWAFKKTTILTTFLSKVEELNDFSSLNDGLPIVSPENLLDIYTNSSFKAAMKCRSELFTIDNYDLTAKIAHNIIYDGAAQSQGILYARHEKRRLRQS